ncbi:hypothetical protein PP935_gp202 [Rhizobium phage RHph_N34]|uniref:Uncharacterized protein n=1 Tax=Rhizobium phage RHph_N34 TaxID=2509586 RepID=A0A7S5RA91_9CAUD|nr:hypothetical protein PP935_gp202 [Rhizobium phage RHph_N34]QIG73977.1 hypothetical protein EVC06_202 [Rhizobium phage RHph_N34]
MFAIIETTYNSLDEKIEVETIAEFETEKKATDHMLRMCESGYEDVQDNGNYTRYHIEAL